MTEILTRAGCFVAIIILGQTLRRTGVFGPETFGVLSKIIMKITLPAAIISATAGKSIAPSMLTISLIGLGSGLIYMLVGWMLMIKRSNAEKAFYIQNIPGYNVGTFALPFTQSFLGPAGVLITSIFDLGNAIICFGLSFSFAKMIKEGGRFNFFRIIKGAVSSIPFLTYLFMIILNLNNLTPPKVILTLADIVGSGNAFLAMLMLGIGMNISIDTKKLGIILKVLITRFGIAVVFALIYYYLPVFNPEVRQTLIILAFSPIGSTVPIFTAELGEDEELSSTINSLSILLSIIFNAFLKSFKS